MSNDILLIFIAMILVLLNGFFVAAEFSLVKIRSTRVRAIARNLGWRGRMLVKVHSDLDAYLSACQLGITLASLGLGWIGEPAFAAVLEPILASIGFTSPNLIHGIAFFIAFFSISYLHIVIGELVPKSMAIRTSERIGLWTSVPLYGFYWLMYPAIWLLNKSANKVLNFLNLEYSDGHDSHYSLDELKLILRSANPNDKFSRAEWRVLAQAIEFRELYVSDMMTPFHEAIVMSEEDALETNLDRISQYRYSRYPFIDKNNHVLGVIHIKDIFLALRKNTDLDIKQLIRPVDLVNPDTPATELFRRFQEGSPHYSIVGYQGSPPIGFITLDNMLSELVGEIRDEFRQSRREWMKLDDGSLLGKGNLPIITLERILEIDIQSPEADTVGGLIMWKLGAFPYVGQKIEFNHFDVVVKKLKGPRILLVRVYPKIHT